MSYVTKDSGSRQEFSSGMVRDQQETKPRFDLLLPKGVPYEDQFLTRWAELMSRGSLKYNARNWEQACTQEEADRFKASAFRHFVAWMTEDYSEDHSVAVCFNMMGYEFVRRKLRA
jgi:hypothetical protein